MNLLFESGEFSILHILRSEVAIESCHNNKIILLTSNYDGYVKFVKDLKLVLQKITNRNWVVELKIADMIKSLNHIEVDREKKILSDPLLKKILESFTELKIQSIKWK